MLEPDDRTILLDALRPPTGYELRHALITTYSLDLHALLFAPLAFAAFDWAVGDDERPNPIALLEALRRHAGRTTVLCQAGAVTLPAEYQPLLVYLEDSVIGVTAPDPERRFHPKLWLVRFDPADGHGESRYRLLCLTRNLTFDRSWDTALVLTGDRRSGRNTVNRNQPLQQWLRAAIGRIPDPDPERLRELEDMIDDVADVRFDQPDGVSAMRFHGFGFDTGDDWPYPSRADRLLVMSPFATTKTLRRLVDSCSGDAALISREETLDGLGADATGGYDPVYALLDDTEVGDDDGHLAGLHAKMVVAERGETTHVYTGSANTTDVAHGGNVEFVVELRGRTAQLGMDQILRQEDAVTTLLDMLVPYTPPDEPAATSDQLALERALDRARHRLGALRYTASLTPLPNDDLYECTLDGVGRVDLPDEVETVRCWRITAPGHQVHPRTHGHGLVANVGAITRDGITSFFAIEVEASAGTARDVLRFVVNAALVGAPEDRQDGVLVQILRDRQDVLRYLLFLLSDADRGLDALLEAMAEGLGAGVDKPIVVREPPLFETLVRALSRDPARLEQVESLLEDLASTPEGEGLVSPELLEIWRPISEAWRQEAS